MKILTAGAIAALLQGIALPALADINVGAYLAARQARYQNDFDAAARYYTQALTRDAANPVILESTAIAFMALGQIDRAVPVARQIEEQELQSQVAFMALIAEDVAAGNHDAVIERIEAGQGVGQLADGLIMAWTELARGDVDAALALFDEVSEERGLKNFALYHKALALASVGDFEAAEAIFAGGNDDAPCNAPAAAPAPGPSCSASWSATTRPSPFLTMPSAPPPIPRSWRFAQSWKAACRSPST
ncbi:tetratricopeptide repeat protein [Roseovarius sp. C03]|uniref:tetratricopeptide repeat protein n=1 Tax=Roseovarius sp. C03 TaxID=3449222 RepID=UPI003EDB7B07